MKEIRGMKIVGEKLTPKEIAARVKRTKRSDIRRVGNCNPMVRKWGLKDPRHFFLHYREEYTPEQKRILKKYKIAVAKYLGTSRKKCPECGAKGHVQIWPIPFGKRRLLCSQCGWTDGW